MKKFSRVWGLRAAGAAAVVALAVWVWQGRPAGDLQDVASLASARTVWWVGVPDLPRFLDAASSSGMARRLENDPAWKSLLEEPFLRDRIRNFTGLWPKLRDVLDEGCALAGVLDPDGRTVHTVLFCRLKRSAAIASTVERLFADPKMPYTLSGRVLVASRSRDVVARISEDQRRSDRDEGPVARAIAMRQNPEAQPMVYVNTELLMAHRDLVPGLSMEFWWLAPALSESRDLVMTVNVGDDLSWQGIATMKTPPLQVAFATPRMWRFMTRDTAVQTVRTMDVAALWDTMLDGMDADSRRAIEKEVVAFDKTVMGNKNFADDFLPLLGPEWGLSIIPQAAAGWPTPPKYALPVIQLYAQIRDPWASQKLRDMVVTLAARLDPQQPPFALQEESLHNSTAIRLILRSPGSDRLGEAFAPGLVLTSDAMVLTSYLPYTQSVLATGGRDAFFLPVPDGANGVFSMHGAHLAAMIGALKEAVADMIVNDHFRMEVEPEVDRGMAERAARGDFAQAERDIRNEIKRNVPPTELEREVQRRLSKYIYEEKLAMMEERLVRIARMPEYARTKVEVEDRIRRWLDRLMLMDDLVVTTRPHGAEIFVDGRLRLRPRR